MPVFWRRGTNFDVVEVNKLLFFSNVLLNHILFAVRSVCRQCCDFNVDTLFGHVGFDSCLGKCILIFCIPSFVGV